MLCQLFSFLQGVFCWDDISGSFVFWISLSCISVIDWWSYGREPPFVLLICCRHATFWCFPKVRVMKLFLSACDGLAGSQAVTGCLEWPPLLALEAFCSHNTQAASRSWSHQSPIEKKPPRAKWIRDEWWRMMGLATLLHGLIPIKSHSLDPTCHPCEWYRSYTWACIPCLNVAPPRWHRLFQQVRNTEWTEWLTLTPHSGIRTEALFMFFLFSWANILKTKLKHAVNGFQFLNVCQYLQIRLLLPHLSALVGLI